MVLPLGLIILFAPCALAKSPTNNAVAAKKSTNSGQLTLDRLISTAIQRGYDSSLNLKAVGILGFSQEHATKKLSYKEKTAGSEVERWFTVVMAPGKDNKKLIPSEIIVGRGSLYIRDGGQHLDGINFRCDLNANAISAMTARGLRGKIKQELLPIEGGEARRELADILRFFTHKSSSLVPEKAK